MNKKDLSFSWQQRNPTDVKAKSFIETVVFSKFHLSTLRYSLMLFLL